MQLINTDPKQGLNSQQVTQKQQEYGLNEIETTEGRRPLEILWDQFTNIMLLMLIAVAIGLRFSISATTTFPKMRSRFFPLSFSTAYWVIFKKVAPKKP